MLFGWLHVWLRVQPSLRYHDSAPEFLYGQHFFRPFLSYPGGLLEYVGAFLAQLEHSDLLGASAAAVLATLLFGLGRGLLRPAVGRIASWLAVILPLLFFLLQDCYDAVTLGIGLGAVLVLALAWLFDGVSSRNWGARGGMASAIQALGVCCITVGLLSYVAGLWPALAFAILCCPLKEARRAPRLLSVGCLAAGLIVPLIVWQSAFPEVPFSALSKLPGQGWLMAATILLYVYIPLMLLLAVASRWFRPDAGSLNSDWRKIGSRWLDGVQTEKGASRFGLGMILLAGVSIWMALDSNRKISLKIDARAERGKWTEALSIASAHGQLSRSARLNVLRALFYSSQLPERMFSYPMPADLEEILALNGSASFLVQSQTLLELGQVNLAEHFACEALECGGERPRTLELLAHINALKGRTEAARVFLRALRQVPFQRDRADKALASLDTSTGGWTEEGSAEIVSRVVKTDQPGSRIPIEDLLRQCLHSNPRNRMAFEYFMAQYLLTSQLNRFAAELGRLADLGYKNLPRYYEEALVVYQAQPGAARVPVGNWAVRPETVQRFQQFVDRVDQPSVRTAAGREALQRNFGDTFWYHDFLSEAKRNPSSKPSAKP